MTTWILFAVVAAWQANFGASRKVYSKICNPMDHGAHGDGKHNDTKYIQKAIDDCIPDSIDVSIDSYPNANNALVYFPKGKTFLSYPIYVSKVSNLSIEIDDNCTLLIGNDRDAWPSNEHFFNIDDAKYINLFGNGVINGQGSYWWNDISDWRPNTINTKSVTHLNIFGPNLTITQCPTHCLEIEANYVEIKDINILNPPSTGNVPVVSHNTDGIDVHGSPFWIHNCYISTGDDNVAVHANDTLVENSYFGTGHGASIGSIDSGWYKNITFKHLTFNGTTNGLRIKSDSGAKAGKLWDVYYKDIKMYNVELSIDVTQFYNSNEEKQSYFYIDGVNFENVTSLSTTQDIAGYFQCQDSTPCKNINLKDVYVSRSTKDFRGSSSSSLEFECLNAYGTADNVTPDSCLKTDNDIIV